jgi:hypothetical protein
MIYATASIILYALAALGSCDPRLTALFTPERPRLGEYQICTTPDTLEATMAATGPDAPRYSPPEAMEALDAFGRGGTYDRFALARAYGGTRARVARGWLDRDGVFESRTLVSPYPDVTLTHLVPGTMIITFRLPHPAAGAVKEPR